MKKYFLGILFLALLVYAPSLNNNFVWDDYLNIVDNSFIHSPDNLGKMLSPQYLTAPSDVLYKGQRPIGSGEMSYRPIVTLTYFFDYALWGLKAKGYHLTNIILHLINVWLVWLLASHFLTNKKFSWIAALIFALHPIQTESVMVISFREDLLATLFSLTAFLLWINKRFLLSWISYLFALFSKESAIVLPLWIFLGDLYLKNWKWRFWKGKERSFLQRYGGLIIVSLCYLWVWSVPMARVDEGIAGYPGGSFYTNVLTMIKVFSGYVVWLLFPVDIHPTIRDAAFFAKTFFSADVWIGIAILGGIIAAGFLCYRRMRGISLGIAFLLIGLLPVCNIIPILNIMAARYLYLPLFGFSLVVAEVIGRGFSNLGLSGKGITRHGILALMGIITAFYILQDIKAGWIYKNEITFRRDLVYHYPHQAVTYETLGEAHMRFQQYDRALAFFQKAKALNPSLTDAYINTGYVYLEYGRISDAIKEFKKAVSLNPRLADPYNTYCSLLALMGNFKRAESCFEHIIRVNPWYDKAYKNLETLKKKIFHKGEGK